MTESPYNAPLAAQLSNDNHQTLLSSGGKNYTRITILSAQPGPGSVCGWEAGTR